MGETRAARSLRGDVRLMSAWVVDQHNRHPWRCWIAKVVLFGTVVTWISESHGMPSAVGQLFRIWW